MSTSQTSIYCRAAGAIAAALVVLVGAPGLVSSAARIEVLKSVDALPAHIAGVFRTPVRFEQAADGQYFVFDIRDQTVYGLDEDATTVTKIVTIGREPGRIIDPAAFDAEANGTFVVADAPGNFTRMQIFTPGGSHMRGFTIARSTGGRLRLGNLILGGLSLQYTGRSILVNMPETGSLITEYSLSGDPFRSIGRLRTTGQEQDHRVHLALNHGIPLVNPRGGYYFVFDTGTPLLQKYDASGALAFERHIEGTEMDDLLKQAPTTWRRTGTVKEAGSRRADQKTDRQEDARDHDEIPLVVPHVAAAAVDASGSVWLALSVPFTYVYDADGEKTRVVQFRGAGLIAPISLSFAPTGRLLVTPGCYVFDPAPRPLR